MGTTATDTGGGMDFARPDPGTYQSRCYRVIDLGTQTSIYQGKERQKYKVLIGWELLAYAMPDDDDGRPFTVHSRYTLSLHQNSALRPILESWRGRAFTAEELEGFSLGKLIEAPCLISIVENESDGKIYTNVASVMSPTKGGTPFSSLENPTVHFEIDGEKTDWSLYDSLSEGLRATIAKSPEYIEAKFGVVQENATGMVGSLPDSAVGMAEEILGAQVVAPDDDVPF